MHIYRLAVLAFLGFFAYMLAFTAQPAFGQLSDTGLDQFGTFQRNHIQTMNLYNLNNHIDIGLFRKKERGMDFDAKLVWDLGDSLTLTQGGSPPTCCFFVESGPLLKTVTDAYYTSHLVAGQTCAPFTGQASSTYFDSVVDQNNTVHPFPNGTGVQTGQGCYAGTYVRATTDGQWLITVTYTNQNCWSEGCITSVTETDPSGNVHAFGITDPNGNQISLSGTGNGPYSWTDPTGNAVFTALYSTSNQGSTVFSYPLPTSGMANIQINFQPFTLQNNFGCITPYNTSGANLASSIFLSDGSAYTFVWESANGAYPSTNITGRIHSITLPAGGTFTYTYSGGTNGINCNDGKPVILTVTGSDGSVWTYNRTVSSCVINCTGPHVTTVVTDPACNDSVYTFDATGMRLQVLSYQGTSGTASCVATARTLLKTVSRCSNGVYTNCGTISGEGGGPYLQQIDEYTYLPGVSQPSLSEVMYNSAELPIQNNEFDFGVNTGSAPTTAPLRATKTTYATIAGNILNRPACVQVTTGASPASCGTVTSTTNSITKYVNYDSHGNVATIQNWISGTTYANHGFTYYSTGLVHTATDPMQHTTTYTYGLCGNSYLTNVAEPLSLSTSMTWDCNGGVPLTSTDENGQVTTYNYGSDPFWRITEVDYPDGGKTTSTYNDTASPMNVAQTEWITSSLTKTTQTNFDALGRPVQNALTSDPSGTTYSARTYDGFGRVSKAYNPTRCSPPTTNCGTETTWGYTTTNYDPLGRVTSVVEQDGSTVGTSYSGNCATATDEVGNSRKSCADALGRITSVWEDPGSSPHLNLETDYTYDALSNLISVTQKGGAASGSWRVRTFTYDGLSRMVCSANPEIQAVTCPSSSTGPFPAGAVTYTYDANSNVITKTVPSPNQPATGSAMVTTTYSYDALNRLTGRTYSDSYSSNPATPAVEFGYDGIALTPAQLSLCGQQPPAITSPTNLLGRRSVMCGSKSASAWSYDQLGRVATEARTNRGSATKNYNVGYTYWKDGSLNTLTYPSGDIVTYTVGQAGRVTQVSDSNGNNFVGYTGALATYAPQGALAGMTQGHTSSFAGMVTSNSYNNRLQPIWLSSAVSGGSTIFSLCHDFHLHVAISSGPCSFSASTSGDNGNVFQIINKVDSSRSVAYLYDPLNRIAQGYTLNLTSANCWGETFSPAASAHGVLPSTLGIDPWGNLTNRSGVSDMGTCKTESLSATATTKNQLSGIGLVYDAAGNVINDGLGNHPTYDAENRISTVAGYSYYYDGDGERSQKTNGSTTIMYWPGLGGETLSEAGTTGTLTGEYIYFNGARIARVNLPGLTAEYYFSNHQGSANVITGIQGAVHQQTDYYPFGGISFSSGSDPNRYEFTGKERDSESGLDNFGARYNASSLGRFMTPDAFYKDSHVGDPQSWNEYAYARNNPLRYVDPTGGDATVSTSCTSDNQGNNTCNVNISASIAIYAAPGSNITQDQLKDAASDIQSSIQNAWTGSFSQDGVTYNVTTQVSVSVAASQDAAMSSGSQNVIGMQSGPFTLPNGRQVPAYVNPKGSLWGFLTGAPDTGMMNIFEAAHVADHEFAHMLGVGDKPGLVLSNTEPWMRPDSATSQDYGWGIREATQGVNAWVNGPQYRSMHYGEFWEKPTVYSDTTNVGAPAPYRWWK